MIRKIVTATASAALVIASVTPAYAQSYGYSAFDKPPGATASMNLRVPLGVEKEKAKPTYGLTFGWGHSVAAPTLDGRTVTREVKLADLRFTGPFELQKAEVATFDLANLKGDRRLNMMGGEDSTLWIVVGIVAAGVAVCLVIADCFDDDDDDDSD
jgi:hypothetical protein